MDEKVSLLWKAFLFVIAAIFITLIIIKILIPSHEDRLVFLSSPDGIGDIYTVNPDGSKLKNLTSDPAYYQSPVWSPDGRKIVFMRNKDYNWQVCVMNHDGTNVKPIKSSSSLDFPAGWSPDGKYLLVMSYRDVQTEIYAILISNGITYRLTDDGADKGDPAWSPDGKSIAYESYNTAAKVWQIYVEYLESGIIKKITDYKYGAIYPRWSSDGAHLSFCRMNGDGTADALVTDVNGKNMQQITDSIGMNIPWCWSPDNKQILVEHKEKTAGESQNNVLLYSIGSNKGPKKLVYELSATGAFYDWSRASSKRAKVIIPPIKQAVNDMKEQGTIALVNGTLIDGTGTTPLKDAIIVIKGGLIESVGKRSETKIPDGTQIIDVGGSFILPGFFNSHVHGAYNSSVLKEWLQEGVTTVCDLGGNMNQKQLFDFKNIVNTNPGYARIISTGPLITAPGGHWNSSVTLSVNSASDAANKTKWLISKGADIIKMYFQSVDPLGGQGHPVLSTDEIKSITNTAHKNGKKVIVHADLLNRDNFWNIAGTNIDTLAHIPLFMLSEDEIAKLVKAGIYIIPTMEVLDPKVIASINLENFVKAGGKVALGSDYGGSPYGSEMELGMPMKEIGYMKEAGMSNMQIIIAATKNAAYVCGRESDVGTLEKGKIADILVVSGNPVEDISNLQNKKMVIKEGIIMKD